MQTYYNKEVDELMHEFASKKQGLTSSEVKVRQIKNGLNKLPEVKQRPLYLRFLDQFKDGLIILLLIAGVISFVRGDISDGIIIIVIVLINAVISLVQEYKAEKSLQALKNMMAPTCIVIRDGKEQQIKAESLVIGDILILEEGAKVPADCRIIEAISLMAEEAALTGESVPRGKIASIITTANLELANQKNMLFMGTNIAHGRGTAIVTATGKDTEFGKIAKITQELGEQAMPLTIELNKVGKFVAYVALIVCITIFITGILGMIKIPELLALSILERIGYMFGYVISVAVAIVPEGLAATVTIALALGVRKMAKQRAIVRKLQAVEALGYTTTICSDKTGTLTKNQMTVINIFTNNQDISVTGTGYKPEGQFLYNNKPLEKKAAQALQETLLASHAACNAKILSPDAEHQDWYVIGDPTEGAIVSAAKKADSNTDEKIKVWKHIAEFSFDSQRRRMTVIYQKPASKYAHAFTKGAPDAILDKCTKIRTNGKDTIIKPADKKVINQMIEKYSEQGLRVLAIATKELESKKHTEYTENNVESKLTFLGLVAMRDPPRDEVKDAVILCKTAGIKVYIITGDAGTTAKAIASEVGIASKNARVITGVELDNMSDADITKALESEVIFARASPNNKMRIVNLLKTNGERVAVTGDGFNDAPALKAADVGIAMGISGTDVAKESADMVLTDDSFATITTAVKEGRGIYDNIKKTVHYAFTGIGSELLIVLFAIFAALPLPITAIQILWIDLGSEVLPGLALGVDKVRGNVMNRKPRDKNEKIMNKFMIFNILKGAGFIAIVVMFLFLQAYTGTAESLIKAQTIAFSMIIFMQMVNTFNCRDDLESIFKVGFFSNKAIWPAIAVSIIATVLMIQVPFLQPILGTTALTAKEWMAMTGCAVSMLVYGELVKIGLRAYYKKKNMAE